MLASVVGIGIHLFAYIAVCGLLTGIWFFTEGSVSELQALINDPTRARELNFWPIWFWMGWAALLVIHVGTALSIGLFSRGRVKQRRRRALKAAQKGLEVTRQAMDAAREARAAREERKAAAAAVIAQQGPERRWVTVMFADIANSTALAEAMGDEEWHAVIALYRELVRQASLARAGTEVGTQGDGLLVRFPTPAEAVLCAVDVQRRIGEADLGELRVRIGIHAGEAVEDEGDLIGRVINLASRVMSEADPGEILVTEPVADYVGGRLSLEDRGLRSLRGVPQPRHLLAVRWADDGPRT